MSYPTASRLRGMSLPDLVAALVAFRAAHGLPCALADDPDAITHLRALDVPAMTSQGAA